MPAKDERVDAYIARSADFAKPILTHLRRLVHAACPEAEETIKWGSPFFMHKGILCFMAAFKAHCAFGFWKRKLLVAREKTEVARGEFGHIKSPADLPSDRELVALIRNAVALNDAGVKKPASCKSAAGRKLVVPEYFQTALEKNKAARGVFEKFNYTRKKDYVDWIVEAKRAETREKRIDTALQWLATGKSRNWKYERRLAGKRWADD
jgi:uncharacterized protein YdeI (YjbR/CyaY-like superfamily)